MTTKRKVAIFLFDEVEVLDFAGPFEVFAVTRDAAGQDKPFEVFTVSESGDPIAAYNGLRVHPTYGFHNCPQPDILLIPGGNGTRPLIDHESVITWIQQQAQQVELLLSVCTGALLLAKAGLLTDQRATTYHTAFERLGELAPQAELCREERWVDNGRIVMSAGISAGIDMSFHVLERLLGPEVATATAQHMEYDYYPRH